MPFWSRLCLLLTTILPASATPATPATLITPSYNATTAPIANLGYASYQGYYDSQFGLNIFKGCAATAKTSPPDLVKRSIDNGITVFDTPLRQLASCVGKHLNIQPKVTTSSKPWTNLRYVHSPALRKPLRYTASTLDQVMKTACSLTSMRLRVPGISRSLFGFVC